MTLINETPDPVTVGSFVRDATCMPRSRHAPTGNVFPFTVAGVTSKLVDIGCAAAMQPPGSSAAWCMPSIRTALPLLDFEAGLPGRGMPTLSPSTTSFMFGSVMIGATATMPVSVSNGSPSLITRLFFQTDDLEGNFKVGAPCNPDGRACDAMISGISPGRQHELQRVVFAGVGGATRRQAARSPATPDSTCPARPMRSS